MNLASVLIDSARRHPRREALRRGGRRVTYEQLDRASAQVARRLTAEDVRPGDRVALMIPNVPEFAAAYYGILRAGAIAVPLDVDLTRHELRTMLADCGASLLIAWRALRTLDEPAWLVAPGSFFDDAEPVAAVEREAGDTAVIVYTSGTTAEPKGVELTHANLLANARVTAELFAYGGSDAVLAALPLAHAFGQTCTLNAPLLAGAAVVLADRFGVGDGVTVLVGVPSMYARLLADGGTGHALAAPLRLRRSAART